MAEIETRLRIHDAGDTEALYARLMNFMRGGLCATLPVIPAELIKRPQIKQAA